MSDKNNLTVLRHSAEHVLTMAMINLYPKLTMAMGPATDDGFYFDFDFDGKISEDDFGKIEAEMAKIIKQDLIFTKEEVSVKQARELFKDNKYKQEWLDDIALRNTLGKKGEKIIIYKTGDKFVDLCSGPHIKSTGEIKAFKLLSIAGAYWRGSEKNKMLTRIYGTAFSSQKELRIYLEKLEEAKKRDHRKIGKELNLFTFSDLVGKGLPMFTEAGTTIWRELERFVVDEEIKNGYKHVRTPDIAKTDLYKKSGHYPYYKDTMYPPMQIDDDELILRPMTCPHHFMLYKSQPRSYRELPLRFAEMASLFRYEKSGELTGLLRVREFCLADSHNFVPKKDAAKEVGLVLDLIENISEILGLIKGKDFTYRLSLGDRDNKEKYFDSPKDWEEGEDTLRKVLQDRKAPFKEALDEAAFYGPKIDIQMKNALGKEETAFTVQYDFCLPTKFDLEFINKNGEAEQPIVIHRSSIGALERSIGFLIEHYAGAFPLWLSPVQVKILPITDKNHKYAENIYKQLKDENIRVELDDRNDTLQAKIRDAQMQKIPYMLIIGDIEEEAGNIAIRARNGENLGQKTVKEFIEKTKKEILTKSH